MKFIYFLLLLSYCPILSGQTTYVNATASGDNTGTSWQNAYTSLYEALTNTTSGDIWVAKGVYTPSDIADRNASFRLGPNVNLYGGFPGAGSPAWNDRDPDQNATILSGDLGILNDTSDNSYTVLRLSISNASSENEINGFTVVHGNASHSGGGFNLSGSLNLVNTITIENCTFRDNFADYEGAGISASRVNLYIKGCSFSANYSGYEGAAISNSSTELRIEGSLFEDNYSDYEGAAISHFPDHYPTGKYALQCINSVFRNNEARREGGAIDTRGTVNLYNCLFDGNSAGLQGGVFDLFQWGVITSTNCTFVNNEAGGSGSILTVSSNIDSNTVSLFFKNCIFKDNQGNGMIKKGANVDEVTFTYSFLPDCPDDASCGDGTIIGNAPQFTGNFNYRLGSLSPCINAGNSADVPIGVTTDLDGNDRISGSAVDMGAYESDKVSALINLSPETTHISPNPAQEDLTIEAEVNFLEASLFNYSGQEIRTWALPGNNSNTISVKGLPTGTYLLRLYGERAVTTKKVFIR